MNYRNPVSLLSSERVFFCTRPGNAHPTLPVHLESEVRTVFSDGVRSIQPESRQWHGSFATPEIALGRAAILSKRVLNYGV
jgi:hypothetical protein